MTAILTVLIYEKKKIIVIERAAVTLNHKEPTTNPIDLYFIDHSFSLATSIQLLGKTQDIKMLNET